MALDTVISKQYRVILLSPVTVTITITALSSPAVFYCSIVTFVYFQPLPLASPLLLCIGRTLPTSPLILNAIYVLQYIVVMNLKNTITTH